MTHFRRGQVFFTIVRKKAKALHSPFHGRLINR
jgi:hypothetical protein